MQQARALGAAGFPTAAPAPVPGRANPTEAAGEAPSPAPAGFVARAPTATMASAPLAAHRQYAAAMGSVAPSAGAVAGGAHVATASGGASAPASMAAASMVAAPQSLPTAAMSAPGGFASPSAVRGLPRPPVSDEAFRSTINKELVTLDRTLDQHPVQLAIPEELITFVPPAHVAVVRQMRSSAAAFFDAKVATMNAAQKRELAEKVFVVLTGRMHTVFGSTASYHAALLQAKIVQRALGTSPSHNVEMLC